MRAEGWEHTPASWRGWQGSGVAGRLGAELRVLREQTGCKEGGRLLPGLETSKGCSNSWIFPLEWGTRRSEEGRL